MTSDPLSPSMEPQSPHAPLTGIVAIGASAGGLEAFQKLLPRLSDTTGFAFVFLQHLDPSRRSQLDQILAPLTRMPVERIHAGQTVEPNHVYVLPEGCLISLQDGHFQTTPRSENPHSPFSPIDFFLESLSRNPLLLSIGVLLSGTGHDGVAGLHHIKSQDGITFAQSSESSRSPEMPFAAERAGAVDFVLPPEEIAAEILRISKTPRFGELLSDPKPSSLPAHAEHLHPAYQKILRILRASTGVDFADYRDNTIRRRIHRRMLLSQCDSLAEYAKNLEANRPEIEALYRDILINVTSFFRDPEMFEALKTVVFPEILKHKSPGEPIRIWVPGCSSGQEVYSIAICLLEFLEPLAQPPAIQIFGTDLSESNAVERARAGLYPAPLADEISPERLARFFTKEDGSYRINRQVRDLCIFAKQNVAVDPPFSRMDLISCRNLLIYLSNGLQKRIIPAFHYSLLSNGFLVLGASETVGRFTDLFQAVDSKNRIYSKISSIQRSYPHFHHLPPAPQPILPLPLSERSPGPVDLQKEADRVLLSRFAPAGVLVSEELEVLQFRGRTGAFLEPPPGEASFNLLRMARESLFSPIRSAIDEARAHHRPARRAGIRLREEDSLRVIDLEVIPLRLPGSPRSGFLVLFSPTAVSPENLPPQAEQGPSPAPSALPQGPTAPAPRPDASQTEEIQQLQSDLTNAKEYLQSIIEQQSAGNEELRAANEEVLSANEELRSANEELQTSKEELQSTNEELTTVNEELQNRNAELARVNDDLLNLLNSVKIPILIFDNALQIRRFTAAASKTLGLIPPDIGRTITSIRIPLKIENLEEILHDVISNVSVREIEVEDSFERWHLLRIHPYRTIDNRIDGAVAVLMDITEARATREQLREARDYANAIADTTSQPLLILNTQLHVAAANKAFFQIFHVSPQESIGRPFSEIADGSCHIPELAPLLQQVLHEGNSISNLQIEHHFPHLGQRTFILNARPASEAGRGAEIVLAFEDITERRLAEARNLAQLNDISAANAAKDQFLAALSHELRTPLTPVLLAASDLETRADLPPDVRGEIRMIRRNAQLEAQLIDDLLDITRVTQGKLSFELHRLCANTLMEQSIQIVEESARLRGVHLRHQKPEGECPVLADSTRLKQVFWNLLSNAIKFTPEGGTVDIRLLKSPHETLRIEIADTGIGIDPEMLQIIFNPFEQGSRKITHHFGGLGLGLAIARAITDLHGGKIWAESQGRGRGTTFFLELPLATHSQAAPTSPPGIPPVQTSASDPHPRLRILIAEDHQDTARVLSNLLTQRGYEVVTAHSVAQALEAVASAPFNLLISDIGLPDGTGIDLLKQVRASHFLEAIALTGFGTDKDRARILAAGFSTFLVKPINLAQLQSTITRLLQQPSPS